MSIRGSTDIFCKVLGNQSMKSTVLKRHLQNVYLEHSCKVDRYFSRKECNIHGPRFDNSGNLQKRSSATTMASYLVARKFQEHKKSHF